MPSESTMYATSPRPTPLAELSAAVTSRPIWREGKELKYWVTKAERIRRTGLEALERGDKEAAYVHLSKAAILILQKIPTHPDAGIFSKENKEHLYANGENLLSIVKTLKRELLETEKKWEAEEKERQAELEKERERERARIEATRTILEQALDPTADSDDHREPEPPKTLDSRPPTPPPKEVVIFEVKVPPEPEYELTVGQLNEKLQAIRLEMEALSRPPSPSSLESDTPVHQMPLLATRAPLEGWRGDEDGDSNPPPTYEEVMGDVDVPGLSVGVDQEEDEYHIEVVEPDLSTGARTPEKPRPRADEKKGEERRRSEHISEDAQRWAANEKEREVERVTRAEPKPASKRSSVSRGRSRSRSPVSGALADQQRELREVEDALEEVYLNLKKLRENGMTQFPASLRTKLDELGHILL